MTATLFLIAAAVAATPPAPFTATSGDAARFEKCVKLVASDPKQAAAAADTWRLASGGVPARHCLGLAYAAQERWAPASMVFEQAAREASLRGDGRATDLYVQSGNAALAGGDPGRARAMLDAALATPGLAGAMRGEAFIDRARAGVAAGDPAAARIDLDKALALVPEDPMGWLLSATLARRQADLPRARTDIARAVRLAPDDAAVMLEAGNIAGLSGAPDDARDDWIKAVALAPDSPAGRAAKAALGGDAPILDYKP